MIGTILHQELLLGGRRSRLQVFRWLYVGLLIAQVGYGLSVFEKEETIRAFQQVQASFLNGSRPEPILPRSAPHFVAAWFVQIFVPQQFILLAIVTPALVAGAVTDEKRRGTLQHLLLADLGTRSLLLGKLFGRVARVAELALTGLPLFALMAAFAGMRPLHLLVFAYLTALTVLSVAAASLLASVWCRQTRDAVLALYVVGVAAGLVVWKVGGPLNALDPLWVLAAATPMDYEELFQRLMLATLSWGAIGSVCFSLAVWQLKPAYLRELEGAPPRAIARALRVRPPIDDEPVRWRERHVEGLAPIRSLRYVPRWLILSVLSLTTTVSSTLLLVYSLPPGMFLISSRATTMDDALNAARNLGPQGLPQLQPEVADGFWMQGLAILLLASLVVSIRCSGAITGKRERQTWEPLLLSGLNTRELIRGKLWGIIGSSYAYLFACGLPAVILSLLAGPLATFWTVVCLAVTVLVLYCVGAVGLYSSASSKSSWQALLWTLFFCYLLGTVLNAIASGALFVFLQGVFLLLRTLDLNLQTALARAFLNHFSSSRNVYLFAICLALGMVSWLAARRVLSMTQTRVRDRERTRQWPGAPVYRRSKRHRTLARPALENGL
jgi:ABC-type transport system involved in multi-copper enzyme maturation permease subunit